MAGFTILYFARSDDRTHALIGCFDENHRVAFLDVGLFVRADDASAEDLANRLSQKAGLIHREDTLVIYNSNGQEVVGWGDFQWDYIKPMIPNLKVI